VRSHLPLPYQDILDFAYYSGWRRREMTELTWDEVDEHGGVIRLDARRSKNRPRASAPDLAADRRGAAPATRPPA
jgi:integrase